MDLDSDQYDDEMSTERATPAKSDGILMQELVNSYYADVYRFALRLSGNQVDAEDLTQQTFLIACRKLHQIKDLSKSRAWLFTIVRNLYLKSQTGIAVEMSLFEEGVFALPEPDDSSFEIDEEALQIALKEMPEAYRTPLLLFYFEEIGYKEIAEMLKVPMGTVMSRLSRGKKFLRSRLSYDQSSDCTPIESTE